MAGIFENAEYKSQLNYYRRMLFNSKNSSTRLVLRNLEIYTTVYHFVFSLIQLTTKTVNTARISSDKNLFLIHK
jgi:hypothetical protein